MSRSTILPGPKAPRPVQMRRLMYAESGYVDAQHARYGDAFVLHFERRPWHVLAHPDAIKEVFTAPPHIAHAGDANEILRPALGSHSVLLLDEGEHMRQRRLLLPQFHGEKLAAQRATIERVAECQVGRMPVGRPFALRLHFQVIALEVILEAVLGIEPLSLQHDRLSITIGNMLEWIGKPRNLLLAMALGPDHALVGRAHRPILAPVDEGIYALIRERRGAPDLEARDDVLSMLLLARDEDGNAMSDAELRDELVTLIVAGHETTATALSWAFERLTRHPELLARLEAEAAAADGTTTYAEAVAYEALRLRPVLNNVLRTLQEPYEIAGVRYPAGSVMAPSIYLVHRRADVYEDPTAFRPERWLDSGPGTYTWIPFGGGVRRCIGASFALSEMHAVLHAVARGVHLEPVGPDELPVARFITTSPARGGHVRVARRMRAADESEQFLVSR